MDLPLKKSLTLLFFALFVLFAVPPAADAFSFGQEGGCGAMTAIDKAFAFVGEKLGISVAQADACNWTIGYICTSALFNRWRMNETSGSTVADSGGFNNGTAYGTTIVSGRFGNARNFSSATDRIEMGSIASTIQGTVAAWVKPTGDYSGLQVVTAGLAGGDIYQRYAIIARNTSLCSDGSWGTILTDGTATQYVCSNQVYNAANFPSGVWTHVVITYDGTNVRFYKDSALVATRAQTVSAAAPASAFTIGNLSGGGYNFRGSIDEVGIWGLALLPSQIFDLYNANIDVSRAARTTFSWPSIWPYSIEGVAIGPGAQNTYTSTLRPAGGDDDDDIKFVKTTPYDDAGPITQVTRLTSNTNFSWMTVSALNAAGQGPYTPPSSVNFVIDGVPSVGSFPKDFTTPNCTNATFDVQPDSATIDIFGTRQLMAWHDNDGPAGMQPATDVTTQSNWASANTSIATVDNAGSKGLVTGQSEGSTLVGANYLGMSDASAITVNPPACPVPAQTFDWSPGYAWPAGSYNRSYDFTISRSSTYSPPLGGAPVTGLGESTLSYNWTGVSPQERLLPGANYYWNTTANYTRDEPTSYPVNCADTDFGYWSCVEQSIYGHYWNCTLFYDETVGQWNVSCYAGSVAPESSCSAAIVVDWWGVVCGNVTHVEPTPISVYHKTATFNYTCPLTLDVTLTANPPSGTAPLITTLTADVGGNVTGTINYIFWWNCDDPTTNVATAVAACGDPDGAVGNINGQRFNAINVDPKSTSHTYSSAGTYRPKVIAERGSLQAESRTTVTVTAPPPADLISQNVALNSGSLIQGNAVTFRGEIRNQGSSDVTSNTLARFEIDQGRDGSYETILSPDPTVGPIAAGATSPAVVSGTWTPQVGNHRVRLCADSGGAINEGANEGNNCDGIFDFSVPLHTLVIVRALDNASPPFTINAPENLQLAAHYDPDGPGNPLPVQVVTTAANAQWSSNDTTVATVDNGAQKGLVNGQNVSATQTATIKVTYPDPSLEALADITVVAFDYNLDKSGGSDGLGNITVFRGASGSNTITRNLVSGAPQAVTLSAGLPAGAIPSFTNNPCNPTCSSTLTISTAASTLPGNYTITVTGSPLGKTTNFTLSVKVPPLSASCGASPTDVVGSAAVTFTASPSGGTGSYTCRWSDEDGVIGTSSGSGSCPSRTKTYSIAPYTSAFQRNPLLRVTDGVNPPFDIACPVINIRNPECSDTIDNADPEDTKADYRTPPDTDPKPSNDRGCDSDLDDSEVDLPFPKFREVLPQ